MRARLLAGMVLLLVFGVGTAGGAQDPYREQADKIPCPAAPPGWFNPPEGGRNILTPLTAVEQTGDPTVLVGAPVVQLDCFYRTTGGRSLQVSVRYALPIDINPWNDFYIGCSSIGHPTSVATASAAWNDHDRVYRVVGKKTWSLATFIDDLGQLTKADVPRFEALTNTMLADAQRYAHDCSLAGDGKPVDLRTIWIFSFDATTKSGGVTSTASDTGSFVTSAATAGGSIGSINSLNANDFHLRLKVKGKNEVLGLHVGDALEFRHGYGVLLRTQLVVVDSKDAACARGAKGTLLLDLQYLSIPKIAITLCGHTYLNGKGKVTAAMKPV